MVPASQVYPGETAGSWRSKASKEHPLKLGRHSHRFDLPNGQARSPSRFLPATTLANEHGVFEGDILDDGRFLEIAF